MDADRDPDRHPVPHRAQILGEGHPPGAQFRVEDRRLQGRLGHLMTLDRRQHRLHPRGCQSRGRHQPRDQVLGHHCPRARQELRFVDRPRAHRAVCPALTLAGVNAHEQGDTLVLAALGGPERDDQRQAHDPQFDGLDLHRAALRFLQDVPAGIHQPGDLMALGEGAAEGLADCEPPAAREARVGAADGEDVVRDPAPQSSRPAAASRGQSWRSAHPRPGDQDRGWRVLTGRIRRPGALDGCGEPGGPPAGSS